MNLHCDLEALDALEGEINRLLVNQLDVPVGELSAPYDGIAKDVEKLRVFLGELRDYTIALSQGNMDVAPPSRRNYLAAGIKQLHAQLRHLTWQAQCIAQGDYQQRVDFMGEFSQAFNTMTDQLRVREESIVAQRNIMFTIFDTIEPIVIVREDDRAMTLYVNQMARLRFGVDDNAALDGIKNPVLERFCAMEPSSARVEMLDDSSGRWYSIACSRLPWSGKEHAILYHCQDITSHKLRESDLERAANTDNLTGLLNRRAFERSLEQAWEMCIKASAPLSMLIFDIDHFKVYNDTYGHLHGDKCLVALARALQHTIVRSNDTVARYGGEEFVALLPFTDSKGAVIVGESVRETARSLAISLLEDPTVMTGITVSVGASSVIPTNDMLPMQLTLAADSALYKAKQGGRNRVYYADITTIV